jgi:hypothetical protein
MIKKEGFNSEEVERLDLEADRLSKRYNQAFLDYLVIAFEQKMKEKRE